jgi:multidrug efflux pump subunit AcrB
VRSVIRFFAQRPTIAYVLLVMMVVPGLISLSGIQRDNFPNVDFNEMMITTRYPGASPEDVERHVTNKIEEELKKVDDLDKVTSFSMENISIVRVFLDIDARDINKVKTRVRDAVAGVSDLPPEIDERPEVIEVTTSTAIPIIEVGFTGDVPYRELREIARQAEKSMKRIPGVASLQRFGYLEREVKVLVQQDALERYQVSTGDIVGAIRDRNIRSTGGSFESFTDDRNIVTLAQFSEPGEVAEVIVHASQDGSLVRVGDLADVSDEFEPEKLRSRMNGQRAISFLVYKTESADLIRTIDSVKQLVEDIRQRLPEGISVDYSNDKSRIVKSRLQVVATNGVVGLVLVLVVLSLFLDWRTAFWVAAGIPVALMGTLFFLPMFDAFLDSIALSAMILVIGIIVDDGIVIGESIWRQRELGLSPLDAAEEGTASVFLPVLTTIITTILAFSPMFFIPGAMSAFVFVIPLVVVIALVISFVEVILALPAHLIAGAADVPAKPSRASVSFDVLKVKFRRLLERVIGLRYGFIALMLGLLVVTFWLAGQRLEFALFPTQSADELYITVELPSGASLVRTESKLKEIEAIVASMPEGELNSTVTRIGNHGAYNIGENENWANVGVFLTPFSERTRDADEIVEDLRQKIAAMEGIEHFNFIVESGGPPIGRPITLRVVGSDDQQRNAMVELLIERMEATVGVKDIDRNDKLGKQQIRIDLNYVRLADFGLSVADVANTVRLAYDGEVVTSVRYGDEDVDYRVLLERSARSSLRTLGKLTVPNSDGRFIELREVADFITEPGASNVAHFDNERAVTITADVNKAQITPLQVTDSILADIDLARDWLGLRVLVGGEAEEAKASLDNLFVAFFAAVLAIYVVLLLLFNSLTQPFMVMLAIPFGLIGVFAAFLAHGQAMGFLAMMGVIGMVGIVINDSLILVNLVNEQRGRETSSSYREVVLDATEARFRAIILTSITTVAGLLPMAYGLGGFDPYAAPMALAMGYGILFATPLTLLLLPCFLLATDDLWRLLRRGLASARRSA